MPREISFFIERRNFLYETFPDPKHPSEVSYSPIEATWTSTSLTRSRSAQDFAWPPSEELDRIPHLLSLAKPLEEPCRVLLDYPNVDKQKRHTRWYILRSWGHSSRRLVASSILPYMIAMLYLDERESSTITSR
jgi:hypothetical protein